MHPPHPSTRKNRCDTHVQIIDDLRPETVDAPLSYKGFIPLCQESWNLDAMRNAGDRN